MDKVYKFTLFQAFITIEGYTLALYILTLYSILYYLRIIVFDLLLGAHTLHYAQAVEQRAIDVNTQLL